MKALDENKLNQIATDAITRVGNHRRWVAAISRAVAGLLNGWIVTELRDGAIVTTESGHPYRVIGARCNCAAGQMDRPCKHRSAVRLLALYEAA